MARLKTWGFLCLIGCLVTVTVSQLLLSGGWQVAVALAGVVLGVLSGGLYAASASSRSVSDAEPSTAADDGHEGSS